MQRLLVSLGAAWFVPGRVGIAAGRRDSSYNLDAVEAGGAYWMVDSLIGKMAAKTVDNPVNGGYGF